MAPYAVGLTPEEGQHTLKFFLGVSRMCTQLPVPCVSAKWFCPVSLLTECKRICYLRSG